jgi:hypothetical protein
LIIDESYSLVMSICILKKEIGGISPPDLY